MNSKEYPLITALKSALADGSVTQSQVLAALGEATDYGGDNAVQCAREEYTSDEIEFDDLPLLARTENGTWVSAWVWVADDDPDYDEQGNLRAGVDNV